MIKNNILGGGSGKVAMCMYERNGTTRLRSMPSGYRDTKKTIFYNIRLKGIDSSCKDLTIEGQLVE